MTALLIALVTGSFGLAGAALTAVVGRKTSADDKALEYLKLSLSTQAEQIERQAEQAQRQEARISALEAEVRACHDGRAADRARYEGQIAELSRQIGEVR